MGIGLVFDIYGHRDAFDVDVGGVFDVDDKGGAGEIVIVKTAFCLTNGTWAFFGNLEHFALSQFYRLAAVTRSSETALHIVQTAHNRDKRYCQNSNCNQRFEQSKSAD